MITLNEQQVAELNNFIQDQLPTKYGVVLLQWFGKIQQEQNPQKEETPTEDWVNKLRKED
jgi:hypothetical protein